MPKPILPDLPTTGQGIGVINEGFALVNTIKDSLNNYAGANEDRIARLERVAFPAGLITGAVGNDVIRQAVGVGASYVAVASKGLATFSGLPDSDGKFAFAWSPDGSRIAILSVETLATGGNNFRATVFAVSELGVPSAPATVVFGASLGTGATSSCCVGLIWTGAATLKVHTNLANTGSSISLNAIHALAYDAGAASLTATAERSIVQGAAAIFGQPAAGAIARRRAYLTGTLGYVMPRPSVAVLDGANANGYQTLSCLKSERATPAGSSAYVPLGSPGWAFSYSMDRITDNLCVALREEYVMGSGGPSGVVALLNIDDTNHGRSNALRLGNAMAGGARLKAVTANLLLLGFTTGSQYATYVVQRDPATNQLSASGSPVTLGPFGQLPAEIINFSATKACMIHKQAATGALQFNTASVSPGIAQGNAAVALLNSFSFTIGAAVPAAVAADAVTFGGIEQSPDPARNRHAVTGRNTTRNVSFLEVLDLT